MHFCPIDIPCQPQPALGWAPSTWGVLRYKREIGIPRLAENAPESDQAIAFQTFAVRGYISSGIPDAFVTVDLMSGAAQHDTLLVSRRWENPPCVCVHQRDISGSVIIVDDKDEERIFRAAEELWLHVICSDSGAPEWAFTDVYYVLDVCNGIMVRVPPPRDRSLPVEDHMG